MEAVPKNAQLFDKSRLSYAFYRIHSSGTVSIEELREFFGITAEEHHRKFVWRLSHMLHEMREVSQPMYAPDYKTGEQVRYYSLVA